MTDAKRTDGLAEVRIAVGRPSGFGRSAVLFVGLLVCLALSRASDFLSSWPEIPRASFSNLIATETNAIVLTSSGFILFELVNGAIVPSASYAAKGPVQNAVRVRDWLYLDIAKSDATEIVDLADRRSPRFIRSFDGLNLLGDSPWGLVAVGDRDLHFLSVGSAEVVYASASCALATLPRSAAAFEQQLFLADGERGLVIVDVASPLAPIKLVEYVSLSAIDVAVSGGIAYLLGREALQAIDARTYGRPRLIKMWDLPSEGRSVRVAENRLYVMTKAELNVYDLSAGAELDDPVTVSGADSLQALAVAGSVFWLLTEDSELRLYQVHPDRRLELDSVLANRGEAKDVRVRTDYAFVADGAAGIVVLDLQDPYRPQQAGRQVTPSEALTLDSAGDRLYVGTLASGLATIDVTDPRRPSDWRAIPLGGAVRHVHATNGTALITVEGRGLLAIDTSAEPMRIIGEYSFQGTPLGMTVGRGHAYVATPSAVHVLRLDDGRSLTPVVILPQTHTPAGVASLPPSLHVASYATNSAVYPPREAIRLSAYWSPFVEQGRVENPSYVNERSGRLLGIQSDGSAVYLARTFSPFGWEFEVYDSYSVRLPIEEKVVTFSMALDPVATSLRISAQRPIVACSLGKAGVAFLGIGERQSLVFDPIADQIAGSQVLLHCAASSGLPVSYRVLSGPASLSGGTLQLAGSGEVSVEAWQLGDSRFAPGRATQTFHVGLGLHSLEFSPTNLIEVSPAKQFYAGGSQATLSFSVSTGLVFQGWSGSLQSADNPLSLAITNDVSLRADYDKILKFAGSPQRVQSLASNGSLLFAADGMIIRSISIENRTNPVVKASLALDESGLGSRITCLRAYGGRLFVTTYRWVMIGLTYVTETRGTLYVVDCDASGNLNIVGRHELGGGPTCVAVDGAHVLVGLDFLRDDPIRDSSMVESGFESLRLTPSAGLKSLLTFRSGSAEFEKSGIKWVTSVARKGQAAYLASKGGLHVFNLSTLTNAFLSARFYSDWNHPSNPGNKLGMSALLLNGDTLYGLMDRSVWLFDVADPLHPRVISTYSTEEPPLAFAWRQGFLYVALDNVHGLEVVDVRQLRRPSLAGRYKTQHQVDTITEAGWAVGLAKGENGLEFLGVGREQTVNFELPAHALPDDTIPMTASSSSGLPIRFDVLSGPARVDGSNLVFTGTGLVSVRATQDGDADYLPANIDRVVASAASIGVVKPVAEGGIIRMEPQTGVVPFGQPVSAWAEAAPNAIFTGWSEGGFGMANPLTLTVTSNHNLRANFAALRLTASSLEPSLPLRYLGGIAQHQGTAVGYGRFLSGLAMLQPSSATGVLVRRSTNSPGANDLAILGARAYAGHDLGVSVYDLARADAPILIGQSSRVGSVYGIAAGMNCLWTAGGDLVQSWDFHHPNEPVLIGSVPLRNVLSLRVNENLGYAEYWDGLAILDLSDPSNPQRIGTYSPEFSHRLEGFELLGRHLLVIAAERWLDIVDCRSATNAIRVASYEPGLNRPLARATIRQVFVMGSYACLVTLFNELGTLDGSYIGNQLEIVDLSSPAHPTRAGIVELPPGSHGVGWMGDRLYFTWENPVGRMESGYIGFPPRMKLDLAPLPDLHLLESPVLLPSSADQVGYRVLAGNARTVEGRLVLNGPGPVVLRAERQGSALVQPAGTTFEFLVLPAEAMVLRAQGSGHSATSVVDLRAYGPEGVSYVIESAEDLTDAVWKEKSPGVFTRVPEPLRHPVERRSFFFRLRSSGVR